MPQKTVKFEAVPGLPVAYKKLAQALNAGRTLDAFGFRTTRPEVYRFANRLRVARAFRGVSLSGYAAPTVKAYGALFRIVATWSAFEQYLEVTGTRVRESERLLPASNR